ncbi:MAG: Hsp20/alpha crystallin family protein [Armatimonadota bacterium]|nr:Hsp20/alpha crystallin family protein [bacterium]MCS7309539.1 Hsp20/alpha crystallin family protein [Armatimonadota bacterium]MDW8105356.1 Hsp20/alpha crystallin family protein [Armatimonadota bacterium]MDW8291233.1 Hsp20/alpha crystallin family protein [Armatimonadota bacterium]
MFRNYRDILRQMEMEMQRLSDEALLSVFGPLGATERFWQPPVDVCETEDALIVKAEIAGVQPDRISVSLSSDNRVLVISGMRTEEEEERRARVRCYQLEIYYGPFERHITLPPDIPIEREDISATYRNGVLTVRIPKRVHPEMPAVRRIPITQSETESD